MLSKLIFSRLEACRFSKGSYTLEFSKDGERLEIGTNYYLCKKIDGLEVYDDAESQVSSIVWDFLECDLTSIDEIINDKYHAILLEFAYIGKLIIWHYGPPEDNLAVCKSLTSGEWGVIG